MGSRLFYFTIAVHFNSAESVPIAKELARTMIKALGREAEGINEGGPFRQANDAR